MSMRALTTLALASLTGLSALTLPLSGMAQSGRDGVYGTPPQQRGWHDGPRRHQGDGPPRRAERPDRHDRQDRHDRHDRRGERPHGPPGPHVRPPGHPGQNWHAGPPQPDWRYNPSAPPGEKWYQTPPRRGPHYQPPGYYPPRGVGPEWRYHRGQALPPPYLGSRHQVQHWQRYGLHAPPRGHHWVRIGTDFVLVTIATGIIIDIIYGR